MPVEPLLSSSVGFADRTDAFHEIWIDLRECSIEPNRVIQLILLAKGIGRCRCEFLPDELPLTAAETQTCGKLTGPRTQPAQLLLWGIRTSSSMPSTDHAAAVGAEPKTEASEKSKIGCRLWRASVDAVLNRDLRRDDVL
jgi:hypothetical protein